MEVERPPTPHVPRVPVRLLVACRDEHTALAIASSIAAASGGAIAAGSATVRSAVRETQLQQPDVLLLEHDRNREEQICDVVERVAHVSATTRILLLCGAYSHRWLVEYVRRGVAGCVLADATPDHWATAVLAVYRGEPWFRRTALLRAIRMQPAIAPATPGSVRDKETPLTAREQEIFDLVRNGLTNKEVGRMLEISDKTVKTHLHNIYTKLNHSGRYHILLAQRSHEETA